MRNHIVDKISKIKLSRMTSQRLLYNDIINNISCLSDEEIINKIINKKYIIPVCYVEYEKEYNKRNLNKK